ncbi:phosphodiester glycosidase family protein [Sporosarcina sp. A2]|uniref:phosphodiester glycosidase family protein n=1 Tax=Sporosarcina sp. A2 TaxID=3393449 RepID=UPI003D7AE016
MTFKTSIQSKKLVAAIVGVMLVLPTSIANAESQNEKISKGVDYKYVNEVRYGESQAMRNITVDLTDPYTTVDVSYPKPLNKLLRTTDQAKAYNSPGQQVAGAINGSFFWGGDQGYLPMYLISYRNQLINAGIIATGNDQFVNKPIAFGVDKSGKGKIAPYDLDIHFTYQGKKIAITSTDKHRSTDNMILYTPIYPKPTTETNDLGVEVVLESLTGDTEIQLGETLKGVVKKVRTRGDKESSVIPRNGFVLSGHGEAEVSLRTIPVGAEIEISAAVDAPWEDASFMLTSGPELVKDGKVNVGMDLSSDKARELAPRTAVAIDKTGTKVFMVTVDGRQPGYSKGMNMKQLAEHLVSIGAYQALNLDGGGSTTMAVRKPGDQQVSLYNRPSDQSERRVSTSLLAVSTAPVGKIADIGAHIVKEGVYLKGTKGSVVIDYVMDQFYNPVSIAKEKFILNSVNGTVETNGLAFTAVKAGQDTLTLKSETGQGNGQLKLDVVDKISKIELSESDLKLKKGETRKLTLKAFDSQNRVVIYDPALIKWGVEGSVGTITNAGEFTANSGTGMITAELGGKVVKATVSVGTTSATSIDKMETLTGWNASAVNGTATLQQTGETDYPFEGDAAIKINYDFIGKTGTSAAYLNASDAKLVEGNPALLTARVYGDGSHSWLRGKIKDSSGTEHTIDFTPERGLKWVGWNFVTAKVPENVTGQISLEQIYIAQPSGKKTSGTIIVDDVKAAYDSEYREALFKDTSLNFRAENEISALVTDGIIAGYSNGKFGPYDELTRQQAAILLTRALGLSLDNVVDPGFEDMKSSMGFYKEVAAAANAGIINGKDKGKRFDPNGKLTRAEMAAILKRGFSLPVGDKEYFVDSKGSFAHDAINSLAFNNITNGIGQGKFGPSQNINRADFSVFLYKTLLIK